MTGLPKSEDFTSRDISLAISKIGKKWNQIKPRVKTQVEEAWENLIDSWAELNDVPLILRKSSDLRGKEFTHITDRKIVVSDNSPAQWVCYLALESKTMTIDDVKHCFLEDQIPSSYAIRVDKTQITYKRTL